HKRTLITICAKQKIDNKFKMLLIFLVKRSSLIFGSSSLMTMIDVVIIKTNMIAWSIGKLLLKTKINPDTTIPIIVATFDQKFKIIFFI
ncbi:MAG: hypothetical protein ACKN9A_19165, partial [Microcystis aeruginosa]